MDSLSKQLEDLIDPSPSLIDPEDDIVDETRAQNTTGSAEPNELAIDDRVSDLRRRTTAKLSDIDARYTGTKVDRKSLQEDQLMSDSDEHISSDAQDEEESEESEEETEFYDDNVRAPTASSEDLESDNVSKSESSSGGDIEEASDGSNDDYINQFSNIDVCDQISKGKALKNQL